MMTTNNTNCPCGSLYLSRGRAFISSGLRATVYTTDDSFNLDLLHSQDIYLESGEKFITVTPIIKQHISPTKISINCFPSVTMSLQNVIHIIVKDKLHRNILATQYIGKYNETTTLSELTINLHSSIDLYDNALIIEIYSLCDNGSDPCCDKLPSEIDIVGPRLLCVPLEQYYTLPTTTTTTTPEPFTIEFLTSPTNQIVNANTKATFSFSAISLYDRDFKYWWEKSEDNGSSWKKASRPLEGTSRKIHTLIVLATIPMNGTKYRVVIIEPKIKYSNIATLFVLQPTTTTTTTTTFNPVTTTLPPCDLQIFGSNTTTTTSTTSAPISSITVSNAGASEVNGVYLLSGTVNAKNRYSKSDNSFEIYWDAGSNAWFLRNDLLDVFYYNTSDTITPPLDFSWNFQSPGSLPLPTFS